MKIPLRQTIVYHTLDSLRMQAIAYGWHMHKGQGLDSIGCVWSLVVQSTGYATEIRIFIM